MSRSRRKSNSVDAMNLMVQLNGPALAMHRALAGQGYKLTQLVRPRQRKDGSFSVRFVWRRRPPASMVPGGVNTTLVQLTEEFRVVVR